MPQLSANLAAVLYTVSAVLFIWLFGVSLRLSPLGAEIISVWSVSRLRLSRRF